MNAVKKPSKKGQEMKIDWDKKNRTLLRAALQAKFNSVIKKDREWKRDAAGKDSMWGDRNYYPECWAKFLEDNNIDSMDSRHEDISAEYHYKYSHCVWVDSPLGGWGEILFVPSDFAEKAVKAMFHTI